MEEGSVCIKSLIHTDISRWDFCVEILPRRLCESYGGRMGGQFCSTSDSPVEVVTESIFFVDLDPKVLV